MSLNDPLANVLSMIKRYEALGKKIVSTKNNSSIIRKVLSILQDNKYIGEATVQEDGKGGILNINLIGAVNNIGVIKPRFSVKRADFDAFEKRFLSARGFGIIIMSTNQGMMTLTEAKQKNLGGKLICYCY